MPGPKVNKFLLDVYFPIWSVTHKVAAAATHKVVASIANLQLGNDHPIIR